MLTDREKLLFDLTMRLADCKESLHDWDENGWNTERESAIWHEAIGKGFDDLRNGDFDGAIEALMTIHKLGKVAA